MRLLMVDPTHFDVRYAINPHMRAADGSLQKVDRAAARRQWDDLRRTFEGLGVAVDVVDGAADLPDMVFAANHGLPFGREIVLSRMAHPGREPEVALFRRWYEGNGYRIHEAAALEGEPFEGMGDCLWGADGRTLFAGHGFRTSRRACAILGERFGFDVVPLRLVDPLFYHLDTCLMLLDARTAAVIPSALAPESLEALRMRIPRLIEIPRDEGERLLAANGFCVGGRHVVIQRGATGTCAALRAHGFEPVEVETGEFLKAGGSVFCLKMVVER